MLYRIRAAGSLLGVTDNTLRTYADGAGIEVKRASDITPGAPSIRVFEPETLFKLAAWRRSQGYIKSPNPGSGPVVIAVDVVKGGTGKTTTAVELALHLQLMGLKTLLIDLDSQANATQMLGYEPDLTIDEADGYEVTPDAIVVDTFMTLMTAFIQQGGHNTEFRLTSPLVSAENVIKKPYGESGPHLIPADTNLGDLESAIANGKGSRELYVREYIAAATAGKIPGFDAKSYDVIIFDCPPTVSFISSTAIAASDFIVAPIRLDAFAVKGLTRLMGEIKTIAHYYKVQPELVILPTHYAPQIARIGRMQTQLAQFRDLLTPGVISASEEFPKSLDQYIPLSLQKPTSNPTREYRMFAEHMFAKILAFTNSKARK
ncbi:MAG: ParA family protein [Curvibacter sp.]|nr:MAG: ParA family protein [Curvibacter sp.]